MAFRVVCVMALALLACANAEPGESDDLERMVGGSDAANHEFPYTVSIRLNGRHHCGGAIISERHILTAAHCLHKLPDRHDVEMHVVTGTNYLSRGGQTHDVETFYYHPKYPRVLKESGINWYYDIGIIKLTAPIEFDSRQNRIGLPTEDPPLGKTAVVSAWGSTHTPKSPLSENLQKLTLKMVSTKTCQKSFDFVISDLMICTIATKSVGTCSGDSGSPLVYNGQVVGIVSGGIPCARGYPDIFTNVYYHILQIKEWMAL